MAPRIRMAILLNNWDKCFGVFADFPGSLNLEYIIKQLKRQNKADISGVTDLDSNGTCPLLQFLRSRNCSSKVLKHLFLNGVDVNANNDAGRSALVTALHNHAHNASVIRAILKAGAEVDTLRFYDNCALCVALMNCASPLVVKMLLRAGCSPNCRERFPTLFQALRNKNLNYRVEYLKILKDGGASLDMLCQAGRSVLCSALQGAKSRRDIDFFIDLGFPTDACAVHGSPILCAMDGQQGKALPVDIVESLFDSLNPTQGVDHLYGLSHTIMKPNLYEFCTWEDPLSRHNLRSNESRLEGEYGTLLHAATYNANCSPELIELLVKRGVPVGKQSSEGETAMHVALKTGKDVQSIIKILKTLLKWGCPVDAKDWAGRTPLTVGVLLQLDFKILRVLLDAGARVTRQNACDRTSVLETALDHHSDKSCILRLEESIKRKFPNIPGKRRNWIYLTEDLLEIQEKLDHDKWCCLLILFLYSFLESPKLDVKRLAIELVRLTRERKDAGMITHFAHKCFLELRELERREVGNGLTLLQLISSPINRLPKVYANLSEENNFDLDKLLWILEETNFIKYYDMVLDRVPRKIMEIKLPQLRVWSVRFSPHAQFFVLNYQCVCEIAKYLSNNELIKLILAFFNFPIGQLSTISEVESCYY